MVHKLQINPKVAEEVNSKVSRLRSVTSQAIACMAPNILLLNLGMAVSFATISIPELLDAPEGISLTKDQTSWFGSISFLVQPLGALVSGPIVDYFGRKKGNFIVNIPHLIAWSLMYWAWNVPSLFAANVLLGLGTGIMEAPINVYVGEISEPVFRGSLYVVTQVFVSLGILIMYFMGTVVSWRNAALISLAAPISSMIFALVAPETPVFLLSKGRKEEALKSLRYLRGWTTTANIQEEFEQVNAYTEKLKQCVICQSIPNKISEECEHKQMNCFNRFIIKLRYVMLCKENLRPLTIIVMYFLFFVMSGLSPIRPNMVNLCGAFGMQGDANNIVLMVGIITFVTSIPLVGIVRLIGKRKLALIMMLGTAISTAALSGYARTNLGNSVFSYDPKTFPKETSKVPLILLYILTVFNGVSIPWVFVGELFPFRSRASSQGFVAATNYIITFLASKTLIDFETSIHLWGAFAVYACFSFVGTVFLYFFLPETEGKTLQEIESYFNGKFRMFADDPFINFFRRHKR